MLRDRDPLRLSASSKALYDTLRSVSSGSPAPAFTLFPPQAPLVGMVAGEHRLCIRLFLPKDRRLSASKNAVLEAVRRFSRTSATRVIIDVDPIN